jgi:hypothetical protein
MGRIRFSLHRRHPQKKGLRLAEGVVLTKFEEK